MANTPEELADGRKPWEIQSGRRFPIRFGIASKLFLLCLTFGLPIVVMLVLTVRSQRSAIDFAEQEVVGNAFLRPLVDVLAHVSRHRRLWTLSHSGYAPVDAAALPSEERAIAEALAHVDAAEKAYGMRLQFTPQGLGLRHRDEFTAAVLSSKWQVLRSRLATRQGDSENLQNAYEAVLFHVRTMITHAGDISNLILDPDLDSYYLMDVTLLALPQMEDRLQQVVVEVSALNSASDLKFSDRIRTGAFASLLTEDWTRIASSASAALNEDRNFYGVSPSLDSRLRPHLMRGSAAATLMIERLQALANASQIETADFQVFQSDVEALHDELYTFHREAFAEEDALLQTRITQFKTNLYFGLVSTGIASALSLMLAFGIGANIVRRVRRIASATEAFTAGDMNARVGKAGKDELGDLAQSFDAMTIRIGRLTAEVQTHVAELAGINQSLEQNVVQRTRELEESREDYRQIAEGTNAIPFALDVTQGSFSYIGPQGVKLLGFSEEQWRETGFLDVLIPRERAARARRQLDECGDDSFELECLVVAPDGRSVDLRWVVTASVSGDHKSVRGLMLDVTESRRIGRELYQAQKLESVGRLAAGVAHEINTPVQFVSDSVYFVREVINDLAVVVEKHRALREAVLEGGDIEKTAREAGEAEESADVGYIMVNVPQALDRALEGLGRVATIVRSMKEFAHPDSREKSPADLNRSIQSTLTIARNEYKYVADVQTDFEELPLVSCYVSEVNQVVLNLIVNAAHAIKDVVGDTDQKGTITISTRADGSDVEISVRDTGTGIPESIRDKIFDPFFTTKKIGSGTGQGLAIARNIIVDKHGGSIRLESEIGKGTAFFIRLPSGAKASLDDMHEPEDCTLAQ